MAEELNRNGKLFLREPRIMVIGVGGAGIYAIEQIEKALETNVTLAVIDSDARRLAAYAGEAHQIHLTHRLIEKAEQDREKETITKRPPADIRDDMEPLLEGIDMVFIVAGMGRRTGTYAIPLIAQICRHYEKLTMAFVSMPFSFEGHEMYTEAKNGLLRLKQVADTVTVIPGERIMNMANTHTSVQAAFAVLGNALCNSVRAVKTLLGESGLMNVDFYHFKQLVSNGGELLMVSTTAEGEARAHQGMIKILDHSLFSTRETLAKAHGAILGILGGPDLKMIEVRSAIERMTEQLPDDARLFWGIHIHADMKGKMGFLLFIPETLAVMPKKVEMESQPDYDGEMDEKTGVPAKVVTAGVARMKKNKSVQSRLQLEPIGRGKFKDVEPTIWEGEDLDVPTFMRRQITLSAEYSHM